MTVAGSGAAGLAAALAAARAGAAVTVLESCDQVGGTTCLSGGIAWVPANHMAASGDDSPADGLLYLSSIGLGDFNPELAEQYSVEGGRIIGELPVRWHPIDYPDYHAERPGGKAGGRSLEPDPFQLSPALEALVRRAPNVPAPITYAELTSGHVDRGAVAERRRQGIVTMGRSLVGALLQSCLEEGVKIVTGTSLDSRPASGPLVLATGGFERDPALARAFLRGPMLAPTGAPGARGGGLRLAMAAGAELGSMSEAWWGPALEIPGETIDGEPLFRLLLTERGRPGSLMVDRRGRRFMNEVANYNDAGRALHDFDPGRFEFSRVPSWLVFDSAYRRSYHLGPLRRDDPDPGWLYSADTLEGLAKLIEVETATLTGSVTRFNQLAAAGEDLDFGRGSTVYDRFIGGLGALGAGPYYAVRVLPGCLGTKGGPRTNTRGQVLSAAGGVVPGLYAAGNAAACPFGLAYPGAGGTIGAALVFGSIAGAAAAAEACG